MTYHASPNGTGTDCTQAAPCDLIAAATTAMAGDDIGAATGQAGSWAGCADGGADTQALRFFAGALLVVRIVRRRRRACHRKGRP
jgi:hypothetical protein